MTTKNQEPAQPTGKGRLVSRMAARFGVDQDKLLGTLKSTAFKQRDGAEITNEQMMALLVVAEQHGLNPFTKEIYAFADKGGIVPVVGVDGWSRIINEHPQMDGAEFDYADDIVDKPEHQPCPAWVECRIYRKDRSRPISAREYLDECYRPPFKQGMKGPWQTHTKRFLRHKAWIQAARLAFGFAGIYDQDEAQRIIDAGAIEGEFTVTTSSGKPVVEPPRRKSEARAVTHVAEADEPPLPLEGVDLETGEVIEDEFVRAMEAAEARGQA